MLRAMLLTLLGFAIGLTLAFAIALGARSTARASAQGNQYSVFLPLVDGPPSCSIAPTLLGPSNEAVAGTLAPLFQWVPIDDPNATSMTLQVASDASFDDPSVIAQVSFDPTSAIWTTGQTRLPGNLSPSTVYDWRTFVSCGSGQGPYSATWSLTTAGPGGPLLAAPTLVSPPFDFSQASPSSLTLVWQTVSGAIDYLVVWFPAGSGSINFTYVADTQSGTNQQVTIGALNPSTEYQWYVQARNYYADGNGQGQPCSGTPCLIQPWQFSTASSGVASTLATRHSPFSRATFVGPRPARPSAK
ncbi:MAG: fibronectin type III domain-containing protein [Chloroflexota bacterium]